MIQCNIRDITSRVSLEKLNNQLSVMYQVILRCNEVLIHETTVNTLIIQMCKVLVSSGGFAAAWVACVPVKSNDLIKILMIKRYFTIYRNINRFIQKW